MIAVIFWCQVVWFCLVFLQILRSPDSHTLFLWLVILLWVKGMKLSNPFIAKRALFRSLPFLGNCESNYNFGICNKLNTIAWSQGEFFPPLRKVNNYEVIWWRQKNFFFAWKNFKNPDFVLLQSVKQGQLDRLRIWKDVWHICHATKGFRIFKLLFRPNNGSRSQKRA